MQSREEAEKPLELNVTPQPEIQPTTSGGRPQLRRASSSSSTTQHAASLDGTFAFGVCDQLPDVYDLGRLAQCSRLLQHEVESLERTWRVETPESANPAVAKLFVIGRHAVGEFRIVYLTCFHNNHK